MTVVQITTHVSDALARLMEQYKDKPNLTAIITALIEQVQLAEDDAFGLYDRLAINISSGEQLDRIGEILNQPRADLDDQQYRIMLWVKIGQNTSQGDAEKLIQVMKLLLSAGEILYINLNNAECMIEADVDIDPADVDTIYQNGQLIVAGGVRLDFIVSYETGGDAFAFAGDNIDSPAKGFSSVAVPTSGGKFAYLNKQRIPFAFAGNDNDPRGFGDLDDPLCGGVFL